MHSPVIEYPEYSAGSETIFLLSLTIKREEIHPKRVNSNDRTTGMMTPIVQQHKPPMRIARDSEMSSSKAKLSVVIRGPRTPFVTLTSKSSSRGKDPGSGMNS
jgi:hypothetical protein